MATSYTTGIVSSCNSHVATGTESAAVPEPSAERIDALNDDHP